MHAHATGTLFTREGMQYRDGNSEGTDRCTRHPRRLRRRRRPPPPLSLSLPCRAAFRLPVEQHHPHTHKNKCTHTCRHATLPGYGHSRRKEGTRCRVGRSCVRACRLHCGRGCSGCVTLDTPRIWRFSLAFFPFALHQRRPAGRSTAIVRITIIVAITEPRSAPAATPRVAASHFRNHRTAVHSLLGWPTSGRRSSGPRRA